jgi:hypothetical protein
MNSKTVMGGGAIILAILIALTQLVAWPGWLNYIWALLALIWGIMVFMQK